MKTNKILRKILIKFSLGTFLFLPCFLFAKEIEIIPEPIFKVENFAPGKKAKSLLTIKNNSNKDYQKITLKGEKISDEANLSEVLKLKIENKEEISLASLFEGKSIFLSEGISPGESRNFNFEIRFEEGGEKDNQYQGKTLNFNFKFLFEGEEKKVLKVAGIEGLMISEESIKILGVGEDFVTITWITNIASTSQIIYAKEGEPHILDLNDNLGKPPKYGYSRTTPEYDIFEKVTFHSVKITDLEPGTTYYYRIFSQGSFAISKEYQFTTKKKEIKGAEIEVSEKVKEAKEPPQAKKISPSKEEKKEAEERPKKKIFPQVLSKKDFWPQFGASIKDFFPPFCFNFNAFFWLFLSGILGFSMGYFIFEKLLKTKKSLTFFIFNLCYFWWAFFGFFLGSILGYILKKKSKRI